MADINNEFTTQKEEVTERQQNVEIELKKRNTTQGENVKEMKENDTFEAKDLEDLPLARTEDKIDEIEVKSDSTDLRLAKTENVGTEENDEIEEKKEFIPKTGPTESSLAGKEIKNTVVLALAFLFVFSAYVALQSLQGSLNDEGGLGVFSLSCLYAANIVACVLSPVVVSYVSVKKIIVMTFTAHAVYVLSNFYPSFATLIPASILLGLTTGPLWTSSGVYLTTCAFSYAREQDVSEFAALSKINGIFWGLSDFCNIIGSLVSSLVLYQGDYNITAVNLSEYCGINDCPGTETLDIIADPEPFVIYILLGVFLVFVLAGIATNVLFLSPLPRQATQTKTTLVGAILPLFKTIATTDMKYLLPMTMYLAIAEAFSFAEIPKSYVSCPIGIQNVGYVIVAYGIASCFSSLVFSRCAKYTKPVVLFSFAGGVHLTLILWVYHWVPTEEDTILIYVLVSAWGLADGLWRTQHSTLLGKLFPDAMSDVFATAEGTKAIGYTLCLIYSSLLCMRIKVYIILTFLVVGMIFYYYVEFKMARKPSKEKAVVDVTIKDTEK